MATAGSVKVLVDSSVWIEFFRKNEPFFGLVSDLMDDGKVVCCGVILAELMQGAKSDRELAVLENFPQVFDFIPETPGLWSAAGKLSHQLRRKGITIGLADCFIAVAAAAAKAQVATLDNHFDTLREPAGIALLPLT